MNLQEIFKKGWFPIAGDICFDMEKDFRNYMMKQESELKLFFSTYGGKTANALSIVDTIELWKKQTKGKVYSFCTGRCSSNGLTILSACDKEYREATENTQFLFHSTSLDVKVKHRKGLDLAISSLKMHWENLAKASEQQAKGFELPVSKIYEMEEIGDDHNYSFSNKELVNMGIIARVAISPSVI